MAERQCVHGERGGSEQLQAAERDLGRAVGHEALSACLVLAQL